MRKPLLLFVVGSAGTGKTTIAKALCNKRTFTFLDKDIVGGKYSDWMMQQLGADINDRDSDVYRTHCRDLEYVVTMDVALDNLELGNDVICVGPFGIELTNPNWLIDQLGKINFNLDQVNIGVIHIYVSDHDLIKSRIESRNHPRDTWKLTHWTDYAKRIKGPEQFVCAWADGYMPILHLDSGKTEIEHILTSMQTFLMILEEDDLMHEAIMASLEASEREILEQ